MSSYSISQDKIDEYNGRGFTGLKNPLEPELLKRLQIMAKRFEDNIMKEFNENNNILPKSCIIEDPVGHRLARFDDIYYADIDTILDLLASPAILAIFRDICGKGCVPLTLDLLYKHQHPHPVVIWHQGAAHSRKYPYLNVGIFLDDCDVGDGCLKYVPNTQHKLLDIQSLSQEHGWDIPGVVDFPAFEGDINIQDMMILHGSEPKRTKGVRRAIYLEIRPYDSIIEEGKNSKEWAELRKRFMGLILRRAKPGSFPEEWLEDYPTDLGTDEEELKAIYEKWESPIPASYATFSVVHPNYPVPSDLR